MQLRLFFVCRHADSVNIQEDYNEQNMLVVILFRHRAWFQQTYKNPVA